VDTSVSEVTVGKITDAYATCADKFEDAHVNEMGRQGWEMVNVATVGPRVLSDFPVWVMSASLAVLVVHPTRTGDVWLLKAMFSPV
jgi:hypothetical protein